MRKSETSSGKRNTSAGHNILSLKNIYRFLTVRDYPVYSDGVIRENYLKGTTLVKFWDKILLYDFRCGDCGRKIWTVGESRNRHVSEVCNRRLSENFENLYANEVMDQLSLKKLSAQIRNFEKFLQESWYDSNIFRRDMEIWFSLLKMEDAVFDGGTAEYFKENMKTAKQMYQKGERETLFADAWLLTLLTLHALLGAEMGGVLGKRLQGRKEYSLPALWKREHSSGKQAAGSDVRILTNWNHQIGTSLLSRSAFFGRERELFELREMVERGGKYLLCGLGGCGKTELLRQFLGQCISEHLAEEIAIVQYHKSITESFLRAFPVTAGADSVERMAQLMTELSEKTPERTILFIDNIEPDILEDEYLPMLQELRLTIFATSRMRELSGFTSFPIGNVSQDAGMLIFRDQYGQTLSEPDKAELENLCKMEPCRHALTIRLMARTAWKKRWTVRKLLIDMGFYDMEGKMEEGAGSEQSSGQQSAWNLPTGFLRKAYRSLYRISSLSRTDQDIIGLFSLFPYQVYPTEYLEQWLPDSEGDTGNHNRRTLARLSALGWLEPYRDGYAMHPLIAESVGADAVTAADIAPFLEKVCGRWRELDGFAESEKERLRVPGSMMEEQRSLAFLLGAIVQKVSGGYPEPVLDVLLKAHEVILYFSGIPENSRFWEVLSELKTDCAELRVRAYSLQAYCICADTEKIWEEYLRQKECAEISVKLYDEFCAAAADLFGNIGMNDRAKEILIDLLQSTEDISLQVMCCSGLMCALCETKQEPEEVFAWADRGKELIEQYGLWNSSAGEQLLVTICDAQILFERFEDVICNAEKAESLFGDHMGHVMRCELLRDKGLALARLGRLEEGIRCIEQAKEEIRSTKGGKLFGVNMDVALAMALDRAGYYERAEQIYKENIIELENYPHKNLLHVLCNNLGVMYQHWGKWAESKEILLIALEKAKAVGQLSVAETQNNLSKVYRHFADAEAEREYLSRALPVLEDIYGNENAKVKEARARMEEIGVI